MARSRKSDKMKFDDGLDEFDDLGFEDVEWTGEEPTDNRKPVSRLAGGFVGGLKDHFKQPSTYGRILKKALPEGYGKAFDLADEALGTARDLYDSAAREIKPQLAELARVSQRLIPSSEQNKRLGKLSDKLDSFIRNNELKQSVRDDLEAQATAFLGTVFKEQAKFSEAQDAKSEANRQMDMAIEQKRFKTNFEHLSIMSQGISRMVGYQDSVTNEYQKRTLELSFKQYVTQTRILEELQKFSTHMGVSQQAIIKNTGLPEFVKIQTSEVARQMMKERFLGKIGNTLEEHFSGTKDRIKKAVSNKIEEFKDSFLDGIQMATMMAETAADNREMGVDGMTIAGSVAGDAAGNYISNAIARLLTPVFASNKKVVAAGKWLSRKVDELPAQINELAHKEHGKTGILGGALDFAQEAAGRFKRDDTLIKDTFNNLSEPAFFDFRTKLTITDVIPGWLSKVHREIAMLRTGEDQPELSYDFRSHSFKTTQAKAKSIMERAFSQENVSAANSELDSLVKEIGVTGLSAKGMKDFKKMLAEHASNGMRLNFNDFSNEEFYQGKLDPKTAKRIAAHFAKKYGSDKNLRGQVTDLDLQNKKEAAAGRFNSMQSKMPDIRKLLIQEIEGGNLEAVKMLGLTMQNGEGIDQDFDKVLDRLLGGKNGLPGNPSGPRGGGRSGPWTPPHGGGGPSLSPNAGASFAPSAGVAVPASLGEEIENALRNSQEELVTAIVNGYTTSEARASVELLATIAQLLSSGSLGSGSGGPGGGGGPSSTLGMIGEIMTRMGKRAIGAGKAVFNFMKGAPGLGIIKGAFGRVKNSIDIMRAKVMDVYVAGQTTPALLASMIRAGEYIDVNTGKTIRSVKDITGEVRDRAGNLIMSAEDFERGLFTKGDGGILKKLTTLGGKAVRLGIRGVGAAFNVQAAIFNFAKSALKSVYKTVTVHSDVYVQGEDKPRLLATIIRRGTGYFIKDTGQPVRGYGDLVGDIVDSEGNVLLSMEDIHKGLVDRFGAKIQTIGSRLLGAAGKAVGLGIKAAGFVFNKVVSLGKGAKNLFMGLTKKLGINLGDGPLFTFLGSQAHVVDRLDKIYSLLDKRMPGGKKSFLDANGDGIRDGSAEEANAERKFAAGPNDPGEDKKEGGDKEKGGGILDTLKGMLGNLGSIRKLATGMFGRLGTIATGVGKLLPGLGKILGGTGRLLGGAGRLALTAGRLAIPALGALASGIGTAAAAVGSVLTAPVVLTVAAVAAIAVGGYYTYKYLTKKNNYMTQARLISYGVKPTDEEKAPKIVALEEALYKVVKVSKASAATIGQGLRPEDVLGIFNIKMEDQEKFREWRAWFDGRFKPVFLSHLTIYCNLTGKTNLKDIDDVLTAPQKLDFLKRTQFPFTGNSPYMLNASPWVDDSLDYKADDVKEELQDITEEVKKLKDKEVKEDEKKKKASGVKDPNKPTYMDSVKDRMKELYNKARDGASTAIGDWMDKAAAFGKSVSDKAAEIKQGMSSFGHNVSQGYQQGGLSGAVSAGANTVYKVLKGDAKVNRDAMISEMIAQGVTDPISQAQIMANVDNETGGFTRIEENLNYKADTLMKLFATARKKGRAAVEAAVRGGPEAIAELIYGGRMDNTQPGDGWRYRGRGFIQITGRGNYRAAGKYLGIDLENNPDLANDPKIAAKIVMYFMNKRVGRKLLASGDTKAIRYILNGGYIGLDHVAKKYAEYLPLAQQGKIVPSSGTPAGAPAPKGPAVAGAPAADGKGSYTGAGAGPGLPAGGAAATAAAKPAAKPATGGTGPTPALPTATPSAPPPTATASSPMAPPVIPASSPDPAAKAVRQSMSDVKKAATADSAASASLAGAMKANATLETIAKEQLKQAVVTNELLKMMTASMANVDANIAALTQSAGGMPNAASGGKAAQLASASREPKQPIITMRS